MAISTLDVLTDALLTLSNGGEPQGRHTKKEPSMEKRNPARQEIASVNLHESWEVKSPHNEMSG